MSFLIVYHCDLDSSHAYKWRGESGRINSDNTTDLMSEVATMGFEPEQVILRLEGDLDVFLSDCSPDSLDYYLK